MDEIYYVDDEPFTAEEIVALFGLYDEDLDGLSEKLFAQALQDGGKW